MVEGSTSTYQRFQLIYFKIFLFIQYINDYVASARQMWAHEPSDSSLRPTCCVELTK
jgi:hypothetical protein